MLLAIFLHREKGPVQIPHVNNQNPETNEHRTNLEGKRRSPGNPGDVTLHVKILYNKDWRAVESLKVKL